jgi:two-component system response regulator CpxR
MQQVLMIDDYVELCEMVAEYLGQEGFTVSAVHNGEAGVARTQEGAYSLILLDVMLPRLNGFEVLRRIRSGESPASNVPVLMLTARGNAVDRIVGLEVGADDYLPKPFEERELLARMRAILRRSGAGPAEPARINVLQRETLRVGDLAIDIGARVVRRGDGVVVFTAVEFDLLVLLLRGLLAYLRVAAGH